MNKEKLISKIHNAVPATLSDAGAGKIADLVLKEIENAQRKLLKCPYCKRNRRLVCTDECWVKQVEAFNTQREQHTNKEES